MSDVAPQGFDFKTYIKRIESHPEFKKLSYREQVSIRQDAVREDLSLDPKYRFMSPDDYKAFSEAVIWRRPVAETPEVQADIDKTYEAFDVFTNPDVLNAGNPWWGRLGAGAKVGLESVKSQVYGAGKASGFVGLPNAVAKYAPRLFEKVSRGVDKVMGRESPLTGMFKQMADAASTNQAYYRDWDKWEQWTDYMFREDRRTNAVVSHDLMKKATTFGVQAAELMAIPNQSMSPWVNVIRKEMTSPLVREGLALVRGAANLGAESGMEMARQYVIDYNKDHTDDPQFRVTWDKTSQLFTENVVGNVVGKTLFNGARVLFKGAKHVIKGKGVLSDDAFKPLEELETEVDALIHSKTVAPSALRNAGPAVDEGIKTLNSMIRVANEVEGLTPEMTAKVLAFDSNYSLTPGRSPGSYDLVELDGAVPPQHFASWDALETHLARNMSEASRRVGRDLQASMSAAKDLNLKVTPEYLNHLATAKGYTLQRGDGDTWVIDGQLYPNSVDAGKALIKDRVLPDGKLSPELGPQVGVTTPDAKGVNYTSPGVVAGSAREVIAHFGDFSDGKVKQTIVTTSDGARIEKVVDMDLFTVYDPTTNTTEMFKSASDGMKWLKNGDGDLFKLKGVAARKGYKLDYSMGHYTIHSQGHATSFKSMAELRDGLKALPDPTGAPELTGLGDWGHELADAGGFGPFDLTRYEQTPRKVPITQFQKIDSLVRPVDTMLAIVSQHAGLPPEIATSARELGVAVELQKQQIQQAYKVLDDVFHPSWSKGRHILKSKENIEIFNVIRDIPTREAAQKALAQYSADASKPINVGNWLEVYDRTRVFFGRTPKEGMAAYNQIGEKAAEGEYVLGYVTRRFRDHAMAKGVEWWPSDGDPVSIAREAGVKEEHLPFFRHARAEDLAELAGFEDPVKSIQAMVRMSVREKYLNPALDVLEKNVDSVAKSGKFDDSVVAFLHDVEGLMSGKAFAKMDAKQASTWVRKNIIDRIPGLNPEQSKTLLDAWMGMGYNAALGFRAFAIARNGVEQPFTVLAGKVGFDNLFATYREMADNAEGLMKDGVARGIIGGGGGVMRSGGASGVGLKRYGRTDEYTRVVAYNSAKKQISTALDQYAKGKFTNDPTKFLRSSGLDTFEQADQLAILQKVNAKDFEGAVDMYSRIVTGETMIPQWRALQPKAIRGTNLVGKVWGKLGTYSFWWPENIRRGIGRGPLSARLAYATRFAAGSAMLAGGAAALGLPPETFSPLQPLAFTGSPWFDMTVNAIKGQPFSDRYEARQARAKLYGLKYVGGRLTIDPGSFAKSQLGTWGVPIPGRVLMSQMGKAVDYINQGQYYRAFLSGVLGAPTSPEYFGDK